MRTTLPCLFALALSLPCVAAAQRAPDDARAHFARAVTLYTDANFEAALVEFQRAFTLSHNPNLLYNLAAAHESLGHFVEARDALEAYRMRGTPAVVATRAAELDARLARLRERIGTLRVLLDTPGLRVRLDGVEVPAARARAGVAVSAGVRVVTLDADGYTPREERREVTGNQSVVIDAPLARARGLVEVRCDVPDATVRVDETLVGRTPLAAAVAVDVGEHAITVDRAGYTPWTQRITLTTAGARLDATLAWRDDLDDAAGARITLRTNVAHPTAALDGRAIRVDGGERVPPGAHELRVERAGYVPVTRRVELAAGDNTVSQWLDATPALREEHDTRVRRARVPAYVLLGAGGVMIAAGVPLLITGLADYQGGLDTANGLRGLVEGTCAQFPGDPRCFFPDGSPITRPALTPQIDAGYARSDDGMIRAAVGGALLGVGVAGAVTGLVLLVRSGSLGGFDRAPGWSFELHRDGVSVRAVF